jgi:NAD dependent epimerase/dehydratase family enzyme
LGGPLGSGEQFMSWIALDDLLGVLLQAIADDRLAGPVNAVAPHAVTNHAFADTLGHVLGRPAVLRAPAPALRMAAGDLADELLLASQLARPTRLEEVGFSFAFPALEDALRHELGRYDGNRGAEIPATSMRSAVQPGHSR